VIEWTLLLLPGPARVALELGAVLALVLGTVLGQARVWRPGSAMRYRVADRLDRRPGMCWARLVCWAEYGSGELGDCRRADECRREAENRGSCYCGRHRAVVRQDVAS